MDPGKSDFDYAFDFPEWWERDVEAMVAKDINHPSVIFYSIGNEIPETGSPIGVDLGPQARREGALPRRHPLRDQRHQRLRLDARHDPAADAGAARRRGSRAGPAA